MKTSARCMLVAALAQVLCASGAGAQEALPFEYAAKIVCGQSDGANVVRQVYATTINVHDPNRDPKSIVRIRKKLALTVPPGYEKQGAIAPLTKDDERLSSDGAMAVDCSDVRRRVPKLPAFFEGFVVIQSSDALDVVAVYTVPGGIDVVQVPERRAR